MAEDDFKIVFNIIPAVPTAGEMATLSCIVVPPDRLVYNDTTIILWSYDAIGSEMVHVVNPDATLGPLVNESNGNFSRNITLEPVKTSDARRYFCNYMVLAIGIGNFTDFTVQSKYMYATDFTTLENLMSITHLCLNEARYSTHAPHMQLTHVWLHSFHSDIQQIATFSPEV